ncbi:MAG: tyrosine-type recombinase/integrase [Spirochaetales bacterium]|nr:tyrosine-type recombinase/integrase [Spirochaetales bacterium]
MAHNADNNVMEPAITDLNLKNLLLKLPGSYKNATKHFIQFLDQNNVMISSKGLKAYIDYLNNPKSNYSSNTRNLYIAALKNRMRFLFRLTPSYFEQRELERLRELLSTLKYEKIIIEDRPAALKIGEIKRLLEKAPQWLCLMIRFLLMTGTSVSEMLKIQYLDIKQDKKITHITIKGKKERKVIIDTPFMYTIAHFFNGNIFLFENKNQSPYRREMVSMSIIRLGKKVLHRHISAQTFRYTFAELLVRKTGKIKGVSEYLGHASSQRLIDMYIEQELTPSDLDIVKL